MDNPDFRKRKGQGQQKLETANMSIERETDRQIGKKTVKQRKKRQRNRETKSRRNTETKRQSKRVTDLLKNRD